MINKQTSNNNEIIFVSSNIEGKSFIEESSPGVFGFDYRQSNNKQFYSFIREIQKKAPYFDLPFLTFFPGGIVELPLGSLQNTLSTVVLDGLMVDYNGRRQPLENMIDIFLREKDEYVSKVAGPIRGIVEFKQEPPIYPVVMLGLEKMGYKITTINVD